MLMGKYYLKLCENYLKEELVQNPWKPKQHVKSSLILPAATFMLFSLSAKSYNIEFLKYNQSSKVIMHELSFVYQK